MLSTKFNCYEYIYLYQSSSYYHKHRVNPPHIEYIAWYKIMFEARYTYYKLLLFILLWYKIMFEARYTYYKLLLFIL